MQIDKRIGKNCKIAADLGELAETARSAGKQRESAAYLERASYEVNLAGGRLRQAMENQATRARETARKLVIPDVTQNPGSSSATTNPSSRP